MMSDYGIKLDDTREEIIQDMRYCATEFLFVPSFKILFFFLDYLTWYRNFLSKGMILQLK